jgi:S-adenosyl-L-methionine hydrolase (adenosine-forming)
MATYTILSDFGDQNYLSAAVKGCILGVDSSARIVEISNTIQPYNVYQASYIFRGAFRYFAAGTHHFLLCGLHNSNRNALLVSKVMDQYVYHVDNELAHLAFEHNVPCHAIKLDSEFEYRVGNIASAFAQASNFINNNVQIKEFAEEYNLQEIPRDLMLSEQNESITAHVLFVDRFQNVIVNIRKQQFEAYRNGRSFAIEFVGNEQITEISDSYSNVAIGNQVAFFNDAGYLEIAIRAGAASKLFGFEAPQFKDQSLDFDIESNAIYKSVTIRFNQ